MSDIAKRVLRVRVLLLCGVLLLAAALPAGRTAAESTEEAAASWLEPRGINVIDLVGLVPEAHLKDIIISYVPGLGIIQYVEGERQGNSVRVKVAYRFSEDNKVRCLGRTGYLDNWPLVAPTGLMRVYDGARDITSRVQSGYSYYPAGHVQPVAGSGSQSRYRAQSGTVKRDATGAIIVPANMGCTMTLAGAPSSNLMAEFTFANNPSFVTIEQVHADSVRLHSYIGGGAAGILDSLRNQMISRFGSRLPPHGRHEGWDWYSQPASVKNKLANEANYVLVKFPPMPVDEFAGSDGINHPSGGTYRLFFSNGSWYSHSVDHLNAQLLPLHWNFQDADQAAGSLYLPTFETFEQTTGYRFDEVKGPEYFLPPGVAYHSCMSNGGCSGALLDEVFNTTFPMDVYFYRVERSRSGLEQIPLRMAGPRFSAGLLSESASASESSSAVELRARLQHQVYVPSVFSVPLAPPPDNASACAPYGCGWFDDLGRMWSIVTPP